MKIFPFFKQLDAMDCGPTCLRMISLYYGKNFTLETLRSLSGFDKDGVSMLGISEAAGKIGFRTRGVKLYIEQLFTEAKLPAILHWGQNHFVILIPGNENEESVLIADPATGILNLTLSDFKKQWLQTDDEKENAGIALLLEPTSRFYKQYDEKA